MGEYDCINGMVGDIIVGSSTEQESIAKSSNLLVSTLDEPILWPHTVALHCGLELWPNIVALYCGQTLWSYIVALYCGQTLWSYIVVPH